MMMGVLVQLRGKNKRGRDLGGGGGGRAGQQKKEAVASATASIFSINNGQHPARFPLSRDRRDRVPLFIRRARGRVGVYRDHDLVWTCRDRHSTDGAGPEHSRGNNRFISILAGRSFLLEIILAIRAALGSGRISRRFYSTISFQSYKIDS